MPALPHPRPRPRPLTLPRPRPRCTGGSSGSGGSAKSSSAASGGVAVMIAGACGPVHGGKVPHNRQQRSIRHDSSTADLDRGVNSTPTHPCQCSPDTWALIPVTARVPAAARLLLANLTCRRTACCSWRGSSSDSNGRGSSADSACQRKGEEASAHQLLWVGDGTIAAWKAEERNGGVSVGASSQAPFLVHGTHRGGRHGQPADVGQGWQAVPSLLQGQAVGFS